MEFPECGSNCTLEGCNQLDLLPLTCAYCKLDFCKVHLLPDTHSCLAYKESIVTNPTSSQQSYRCSLASCQNRELVPLVCPHCRLHFCLDHRHQSDHQCSRLEEPKERMVATKQLVQKIVAKHSEKPAVRQGVKSQRLAAKVQLMKLKQRSKGSQELPSEERVYFLVELAGTSTKSTSEGVFVSRLWSVGKCIDAIASLCRLANHNNVAGRPHLNLFDGDDGARCLSRQKDILLGHLLDQEMLFNGQTLRLSYADSAPLDAQQS